MEDSATKFIVDWKDFNLLFITGLEVKAMIWFTSTYGLPYVSKTFIVGRSVKKTLFSNFAESMALVSTLGFYLLSITACAFLSYYFQHFNNILLLKNLLNDLFS